MPTIPSKQTLTQNTEAILNAIRNNASANYQAYIPAANGELENLREIGTIMMQNTAFQNEFLNALYNRIAMTIITSKQFYNPWQMFKRGMLNMGETIEEIFVNLADPHKYDPATAESEVFKRETPDVRSAFHVMNYRNFYKRTINQSDLKQAFLSMQGVTDLIGKMIERMIASANYDEFMVMKYMVARNILNGRFAAVTVPELDTAEHIQDVVSGIKETSTLFTIEGTKYNPTAVYNHCDKEDQYIILNAKADSKISVKVLATSFNMDEAKFMGHQVPIDSFGELDNARLALLFAGDSAYVPITDVEKAALDTIPAVLVDKNYFMVFDNLTVANNKQNEEGLYFNYWYHVWKTMSTSPFANAAVFVPGTPSVTSVTVTPATATMAKGTAMSLTLAVVTDKFASKAVKWTISGQAKADTKVDLFGNVQIAADETATTITVTATSVVDETKLDTCVITIA
jgi:hypothetical protein